MVLPHSTMIAFVRSIDVPFSPVDLQTRAIDLAYGLGSLRHFLEAARELLTCNRLPHSDFKRHNKKIITLIEIARATLIRAGLQLHTFTSCSAALVPYKAAYFDLIQGLGKRHQHIDVALKGRMNSLLLPLSTGFLIQRTGDPHPCPTLPLPNHVFPDRVPRISSSSGASSPAEPRSTSTSDLEPSSPSMPPPDAFPIALTRRRSIKGRPRGPRLEPVRIWGADITKSPRRRRASGPKIEQENVVPSPRLLRPLPRRFGIFCTGKNSMHRPQERVRRHRAVCPMKKE